ncbi:hypothetical protein CHS0354_005079 [Potamilus streckersoni]|uniref:Histone-lysine N-methyltransferase SETDB1 n=1 Tax=Potamilus streckersoni TaxID=2493646 RepID=A0AAE0SH09_9BIVA|nr:hypothetical protein CHS0354_005079 [Potamilus streckersoni]
MTMTTFEFSSAIDLDGLITSVLNELCDTQANEEARAYDSNIDQLALQVKTTERKVQSINRSYADCMSQLDSYKETLEDEQRDDEIKLKEAEEAAAVAAAQPEIIEDDSDDDDDVQFIQKTFDPDMAAKRQIEVSSVPVPQIQIVQKPVAPVQQTFQPILPKGGLPLKQAEHASSPTLATLRAALKASINKQLNHETPREEPAPPPPAPPPPPPQVIVVSSPATTEIQTTRILPVTTQPVVTTITTTTTSTISSISQTQVRTASSFVTQNSQATEKAFAEEINNANAGTNVLVRKTGDIWYPGVIVEVLNIKQPIAERRYRVKYETSKGQKVVNGKQLAFAQSITRPVSVGSRVTALYKDEETKNSHYAGIVAESPNGRNQLRYLIFFDDGYAQYCSSKEIFKVFEQSENVWEDVHPDSKEFIKEYLAQYPERPMVRLHKGQSVKTEWKGTWWNARVEEVDASLVLMYFAADKRHEWIYRGSTRLEPLFTALANAEANRLAGRGRRHNLTMAGSKKPVVEYTRQNTSDTQTGNSDEKSSRNKEDADTQPPSSIEKKGMTKSASDPSMESKKRPVARKSTTGKMPSNTEEKPKWEPPWTKMQRKTALQVLQSREAEVQQQQNRETESEEKYQASSISSNKTGTDMASVLQERLTQAVADDEMMEKESFGERMDKVISIKSKDSKSFKPHLCGPHCLGDDGDDPDKHNGCNPLLIPLFCGWERHVCKLRPGGKRVVMYRAPCSRRLRSMEEVDLYLLKTDSQLTINLFCYDPELHVHAEFVPVKTFCDIKDLSYGKENMSISCVNGIDRQYPEYVDYSNQRIPANGVKLNVDPDFLVCCSCTDGCRDKNKCDCQQLTIESTAVIPPFKENPDAGYINMRLKEPLLTGIYECNSRCKCGPKCVNRVVQHGLRNRLQVYKTEKRGWGLRCLDDIPAGGFICIYAGQLLTDQGANEDGQQYGDEYLAELDYIEVVERHKEGYESDVDDDDEMLGKDEEEDEEESDEEDRGSSNSDCSFEGGRFDGVADKRHDTRKRTSDDREIGKLVLRRDSSRSGDGDHCEWSVRIKDKKENNGEEEQEVQVITDNAEKNLSGTESMDVDELPDLEPPDHSNKISVKEEEEEDVEEMEVLEHSHSQKRMGRSTASRFGNLIPHKLKKEDSDKDRDKGEKRLSTRYYFKDSQQCYIMDAKSMGNIGRYLNHSCSPNAFVQNVFVDTHDLRFPWVAFFAGQFIRAGSELTWDYNYEVGSVPGKVLYCYCGSADCRGRLL